jgi:hypothetical protein
VQNRTSYVSNTHRLCEVSFCTVDNTVSTALVGCLGPRRCCLTSWQRDVMLTRHTNQNIKYKKKILSPLFKPITDSEKKVMSLFFEATNITKARPDGSTLFRNVCISLERGDVLTLRGPSGVGYVPIIKF